MDQPGLDEAAFLGSLRGIRRINAFTFVSALLWSYVKREALDAERPLRVLDIGSGAGDGPIALARRAGREGLNVSFVGSDRNEHAVDFAQAAAKRAGVPVEFQQLNAIDDRFPEDIDIVMSSLFLHHLEDRDAVQFLSKAKASAKRAVIVHDLERSRLGYWFAYFGVRILSRSRIVHTDGPRSVEGAFTAAEASALADEAGLNGHRIDRRFPFRWVLHWRRP